MCSNVKLAVDQLLVSKPVFVPEQARLNLTYLIDAVLRWWIISLFCGFIFTRCKGRNYDTAIVPYICTLKAHESFEQRFTRFGYLLYYPKHPTVSLHVKNGIMRKSALVKT